MSLAKENNHTTISSSFGNALKTTIFGGSHEPSIGVIIQGLPPKIPIDLSQMQQFLSRRAPGRSIYVTPRKEPDIPVVKEGLVNGKTTGDPLVIIIKNTNIRSHDYKKVSDVPRPSHADYTAHVKYGSLLNMSGGGPFSARMTAPLCIAGAIALQILEKRGIFVGAHIASIGSIADTHFDPVKIQVPTLQQVSALDFPVLNPKQGKKMKELLRSTAMNGDSIGGTVECCTIGLPAGLGGPMYDGVESVLSHIYFGIPAVKGVEFGSGFSSSKQYGSMHNDPFYMDEKTVKTKTNNHGGILGGITSGMPLLSRVALKPTPSIAKPQQSVDLSKGVSEQITVNGRHDPCVAVRAVPIIEAATAIGLLDLLIRDLGLEVNP